jgi:hypothetical protein
MRGAARVSRGHRHDRLSDSYVDADLMLPLLAPTAWELQALLV